MQLKIFGTVQGVGFRPFIYKIAKKMDLTGFVRNNGSNVEIVIDGDHKRFLELFKEHLPPLAKIDYIEKGDGDITEELLTKNNIKPGEFKILFSTDGIRESAIPPDTSLCIECLSELFNRDNRRHHYPFINCTDCGARFSVIKDMPYDRDKTAMQPFELCDECKNEFIEPTDRRMHAQTISCPKDGPEFSLYTKGGKLTESDNPIKDFAKLLDAGNLGIIKSWGGMHIVSAISEIERMRDWYNRPQKPFAVMIRDLEAVEKYCDLNNHTKNLLEIPQRPIVLLPKRKAIEDSELLEKLSPGIDTLGVYLPYSPIQYMLFHYLKKDALIMTSANPQGEPLIIDNDKAFELDLDAYLLHNREIINRVDDSIINPHNSKFYFLRKSRGFVPEPIDVCYRKIILSVGAERNVTAAVSKNGKLYTSQYIGNTYYYNTLEFLEEAIKHLLRLLGIDKIDGVAFDLHPQYPTRRLALELAEKYKVDTFEIQHHWAHATALMLDAEIHDPMIALTLDGAGYGPDGTIWGGEVLFSYFDRYKQLGSLERIPLIGGDMAVHHPKRLVFGIYDKLGLNPDDLNYFRKGEAEVYRNIIKTSPQTSSLGRVLDSIACYLGIAPERTYDGEPAMKLERYLAIGKPEYQFKAELDTTEEGPVVIQTSSLFKQLFDFVGSKNPSDLPEREKANLSYSFVSELMKKLVHISVEGVMATDANYIGLSGGVTYNLPLVQMVEDELDRLIKTDQINKEVRLVTHSRLPNGDGCISTGQNIITGHMQGEDLSC
jgi:hydrogenase maturation protein HypF